MNNGLWVDGTNDHQKTVYFRVGYLEWLLLQVFHTYTPGGTTQIPGPSRTGAVLCQTFMTKHGTEWSALPCPGLQYASERRAYLVFVRP